MAKLYAKDIVVRIPDGEYFAMPMLREKRHRVSDRPLPNGCGDGDPQSVGIGRRKTGRLTSNRYISRKTVFLAVHLNR